MNGIELSAVIVGCVALISIAAGLVVGHWVAGVVTAMAFLVVFVLAVMV